MKKKADHWKYTRCIDCDYFGHHGAYCDLQSKQELCFRKACAFFQWKKDNVLRHMDPGYFFPNFEDYRTEMELRGMEPRKNYIG